jgi:flagellar motor switch protein FliM
VPENVSPEEIDALVGDETTTPQEVVKLRDFRQPRRLSAAQQQSLRLAISQALPAMEGDLSIWLRGECTLSLTDLGEATAVGLFDDFADPLSILTFEVDGAQGWVVWDTDAALRASIIALGTEIPEDFGVRPLSPMEQGLVTDMLGVFTSHIGRLLGLELATTSYSQDVRDFLTQHEADEGQDLQRLYVHLNLESGAGSTVLRFYLPGILPDVIVAKDPLAQLPTHLGAVSVEVCAEFGCVDVALPDLMQIEVGDVIPLNIKVGDSVNVRVEGNLSGQARWGQHNGMTSIIIERLSTLP